MNNSMNDTERKDLEKKEEKLQARLERLKALEEEIKEREKAVKEKEKTKKADGAAPFAESVERNSQMGGGRLPLH